MPPVIRTQAVTSTTTITNSTAEARLATFTLPSNLLTTGRSVRGVLAGQLRMNESTAAPTLTLYLRVSTSTALGTLIAQTTAMAVTSSTKDRKWTAEVGGVATSTADQRWRIGFNISAPSTAGIGGTGISLAGIGTSTKDYDQALRVQVTAKWSAANSSASIDSRSGWLELVR